jgi:hypothetical protein
MITVASDADWATLRARLEQEVADGASLSFGHNIQQITPFHEVGGLYVMKRAGLLVGWFGIKELRQSHGIMITFIQAFIPGRGDGKAMLAYIEAMLRSRREPSIFKAEVTDESKQWWLAQGFTNGTRVFEKSIVPA